MGQILSDVAVAQFHLAVKGRLALWRYRVTDKSPAPKKRERSKSFRGWSMGWEPA